MWGNFNQNNGYKGLVMFCRKAPTKTFGFSQTKPKIDESNPRILFILSKYCDFSFFDFIPKNFSISTKNATCNFNLDMLKEISPVISKFVEDNPEEKHYSLNIIDEENVLAKYEKLFKGETVKFDEDEVPSSQRITKILKIKNCPNYLKPESLKVNEIDTNGNSCAFSSDFKLGVQLHITNFLEFMKEERFQTFKIKTNKKEYQCNIFSVYSSNVIRQMLEKDPTITEYVYDFEDEYDEFQSICDFFNFKSVDITSSNMDSIELIVEDLKIDCIKKQVNNYINNYEKFTQKVDEQQTIIDSIDNLFDLLYNIKTIGVKRVKTSILESKLVESDESVQELAAFIIQVVKPDFSLHQEMADLLIQLNEEANDTNKLKALLPFVVTNLLTYFMPNTQTVLNIDYSNPNGETKFGSLTTAFGTGTTNAFGTGATVFGTGAGAFGAGNANASFLKRSSVIKSYNDLSEPLFTNNINDLNSRCVFAFIRILYNKGIIPKEKILSKLKNYNLFNKSLNAFFLPEIIELNPKSINTLLFANLDMFGNYNDPNKKNDNFSLFIDRYLPDKIDQYKRMLDSMEPEDDITKSLRHDDVDKLQMIITRNEIDISKAVVPYNIFDDFEVNQSILNYAALYGSLKCFKYLLLNNGKVDESTLYFAVYGGNIEIIKIVDHTQYNIDNANLNQTSNNNNNNPSQLGFGYNFNNNGFGFNNNDNMLSKVVCGKFCSHINFTVDNNIISSAIKMHRNELFDWIFEKLFVNKGKIGDALKDIALLSAANGNAHSLIEIIDKGFDISSCNIIYNAAKNGFCKLTKLLLSMVDQKIKKDTITLANSFGFNGSFDYQTSVYFGNLSIFKLFMKQMDTYQIESAILYAIKLNYSQIYIYYFNNLNELKISISDSFVRLALNISLRKKTDKCFNFLNETLKNLKPNLFNAQLYATLLNSACLYSNLSAVKTITDILLNDDPKFNFSTAFASASSSSSMSICQYFLDKKVSINYEELSSKVSEFGSIDEELFKMILNKVSPNSKQKFLKCIYQAIQKKNKKLVEFLLKENAPIDTALFEAVLTHDLDIVNLILDYNSTKSYVNKKSNDGTALHIACKNKDLDIVKRLLSIPGIDPSLYNHQNDSPLIVAIKNLDIDIIDAILDFYGDEIQSKVWLLNDAFRFLFRNIPGNKVAWKIIKRFYEIKSIDPNFLDQETFLCKACLMNEIEMVKTFLEFEKIDVNMYEIRNYNTPLMIAIENGAIEIAKLLINFLKTDLNLRNSNDESALNIAVRTNQKEIIDLLIRDERFDPIESKLDFAFFNSNAEISKQLSSLSFLDVSQSFDALFGLKTALTKSVRINDVEKIDIIIHHPSFDPEKSEINEAIYIAAKENNIDIFKKLIELADININMHNKNNNSLLYVASYSLSGNIVDYILNNPQFDCKSSDILKAFVGSFSNQSLVLNQPPAQQQMQNIPQFGVPNPQAIQNMGIQQVPQAQIQVLNRELIPDKSTTIDIMNKLLNYDREHDNLIDFSSLLPNGKSFFTSILDNFTPEIGEISNFLLENGVDPNAADKKGVYPLQQAIYINSFDLASSLINTDKIEFKTFEGGQTYLHIAAKNQNEKILKLILNKNVIDINSKNSSGCTPLMLACEARKSNNINLLFERDDLDYLCCNNCGQDALQIIRPLKSDEEKEARQSRENYHNKLIALCNEQPNFVFKIPNNS